MLISFDKDQLVMRRVRSANKTKWDTWKTKYLSTLISPVGSLVQHTRHSSLYTNLVVSFPSLLKLSLSGSGEVHLSPALPLSIIIIPLRWIPHFHWKRGRERVCVGGDLKYPVHSLVLVLLVYLGFRWTFPTDKLLVRAQLWTSADVLESLPKPSVSV